MAATLMAQTVHSAADLFPLPALAYLRAAQGERIALICRGVGGSIQVVEALNGQLVWFFPSGSETIETLLGERIFDVIVEYTSVGIQNSKLRIQN
jgi:hypothetical protein